MSIDWLNFSPTASLIGGLLIGIACTLLLLGIGRFAGISGIVGGLLDSDRGDSGWKAAFVAGLVIAPSLLKPFSVVELPDFRETGGNAGSLLDFILGGFMAGIGARLAKGCTSGHGICGLGRFSRRSVVAVVLFMSTAVAVTYIYRHLA
ncbi:MAG: YeeE/YedE family protein [Candidatus Accumulibacter sp.]|jgi:uncharacterized membrane protein YedE/YeeE|nr:YeeE/YedE family protein [Accumulibacter sp.]